MRSSHSAVPLGAVGATQVLALKLVLSRVLLRLAAVSRFGGHYIKVSNVNCQHMDIFA